MQARVDPVGRSLAIMEAGQAPNGAFVASPTFPVYHYSWFRDGTFIAQALDEWGKHEPARRFYEWGTRTVLANADDACAALVGAAGEPPARYLHTRYALDGARGGEDWPNFQLDGFGTFLWGLVDHLDRTDGPVPEDWHTAVGLLTKYLRHLWRSPNFDCWEEYPDKVHVATLSALYGGLQAVAHRFQDAEAADTAQEIRAFVLGHSAGGHLPKFIGSEMVDASLLWACIPFGMLAADDPLMVETAAMIERDLVGPHGGVHRYADDSYYGGGAWPLLTAMLGEYFLLRGDAARARSVLTWIERQASPTGDLPEQVPHDLNHPEMYQPWVERWGQIARPLLWSHAAYLHLKHALTEIEGSPSTTEEEPPAAESGEAAMRFSQQIDR
jgi:GH15 family glucan-1,4-alpha-glucosidase